MAEKNQMKKKRRYVPEEERREQILGAAIAVFSEKGYYKAKMQEIASRAGVANGTVYRYYPSKFLLATEIIGARGASGFVESLQKAGLEELSPEEFLKTTAQRYFGNLGDRLPLIRFRISEALSNSDLGRQYYPSLLHRLITDLAGLFAGFQEKGLFKQGDPFILAHIYYGILFGFLYCQELMLGKEVTHIELDKMIEPLVDVFLHGVKNESKGSN
jgi:AcrR family transcriptional regulator